MIIQNMLFKVVHYDILDSVGEWDIIGEICKDYLDGLVAVNENDDGGEEACAEEYSDGNNDEVAIGPKSLL